MADLMIRMNYTEEIRHYNHEEMTERILRAQQTAGKEIDSFIAGELAHAVSDSFKGADLIVEDDLDNKVIDILAGVGQAKAAKYYMIAVHNDNQRRLREARERESRLASA